MADTRIGVSGVSGTLAEGGAGVISADGNVNLTSGEETDNLRGTSCHSTLAGTYIVTAQRCRRARSRPQFAAVFLRRQAYHFGK